MEGTNKKNLVYTRTQKKEAVTPQETDPDLPGNVQESPVEAWVISGLLHKTVSFNNLMQFLCELETWSMATGNKTGILSSP